MPEHQNRVITIKIPVAVDVEGNWIASGSSQESWDWDDFMEEVVEEIDNIYGRYWIIAEVPVPELPHSSDPQDISGSFDPD